MNPIAQIIFRRNKFIKNYLFVFPDKSIVLRTLVLNYKVTPLIKDEKIIARKFGKRLIQRKDIHISAETIAVMNHLANEYKFDVPEGTIQYGKITKIG